MLRSRFNRSPLGLLKGFLCLAAATTTLVASAQKSPMLSLAISYAPVLAESAAENRGVMIFRTDQLLFGHVVESHGIVLTETRTAEPLSTSGLSVDYRVGKPIAAEQMPLTTRHNLREYGHAHVWATVSAGYGQFVYDRPLFIYRPYDGWSEPGCGYLKVTFSF
jgi:hypothetical protein